MWPTWAWAFRARRIWRVSDDLAEVSALCVPVGCIGATKMSETGPSSEYEKKEDEDPTTVLGRHERTRDQAERAKAGRATRTTRYAF